MNETHDLLRNQPVRRVFFHYFIPSLFGLMLMSVNILIDGIFVGNGVGSVALGSVNLAMPVFSLLLSISLWIGIGGGTLYSMHVGSGADTEARSVFSLSVFTTVVLVLLIGGVGYFNVGEIAGILGANEDTLPYVIDYLAIMFLFGWLMALQQLISIFVRNDGSPRLSMISLAVTAVSNIGLNYYMIFVLELGVKGAAIGTVIAEGIGLLVILTHFMKKGTKLRAFAFRWSWKSLRSIFSIGFPSYLAEMGMLVFVTGYNLAVVGLAGTEGVAAFSVINYLHGFMFLSFFGIESALQPMISFYYGARQSDRIKRSVEIGERAALILGVSLFAIGLLAAPLLITLFGLESQAIKDLAIQGIRLFFIAYLFMGFNFIYMTYFQSIGQIRPSIFIIVLRSFILMLFFLWILPKGFGISGVWLSVPVAEALVAIGLFVTVRKRVRSGVYHQRPTTNEMNG
ncbi:multidrug transporter MatE [Pontibacillus halophilus JSM 076056 = DSM 19796]|uniref:Multidrug export protein MepA n=1 Tax=Pontibacillus halophilus JSM 076056 = DSM 19796 TaxID=1385510 RepID=A0A0A5GCX9_9BACI|nr:MATE family efflux transporter [Pontibacillus halophilus]KGX91056.1 multidrug transporter MatE [Pontibacillus halophilus JSM 076056 = DSM 19796]